VEWNTPRDADALWFVYVRTTVTTAMRNIREALGAVLKSLSDKNYQQSLARCRLWVELGQTYSGLTPSDLIFDAIWENKKAYRSFGARIYPAAPLILRFVDEAESDPVLAPYSAGLRSRLCAMIMQEFIEDDLGFVYGGSFKDHFYMDVNLIAHCVNHGYIEEAAIRNHILQPLISHQKFLVYHAHALAILFKIAGATFEAYADSSAVNRCFKLFEEYLLNRPQDRQWILVGSPSIEGR